MKIIVLGANLKFISSSILKAIPQLGFAADLSAMYH